MASERDPIPCPVCREVIIGPLSAAVHLSDMHGLSMYGALARLTRELEEARERERAVRDEAMAGRLPDRCQIVAERIRAALRSGSGTPPGEGERGLIMRTMLETFPWSLDDIRQGHFERAADAVIAALRSEAQGGGGCGSANVYPTDRSEGDVG